MYRLFRKLRRDEALLHRYLSRNALEVVDLSAFVSNFDQGIKAAFLPAVDFLSSAPYNLSTPDLFAVDRF